MSLSSPQVACEKTVSAMQHVLQRTIRCAKGTRQCSAFLGGGLCLEVGKREGEALPPSLCLLLPVRGEAAGGSVEPLLKQDLRTVGRGRVSQVPPHLL